MEILWEHIVPAEFRRIARISAENVRFYKVLVLGNEIKFPYFTQWRKRKIRQNNLCNLGNLSSEKRNREKKVRCNIVLASKALKREVH